MLRSSLCDYSDAYKLVSGTTTITATGDHDPARRLDKRNTGIIFRNWVPFPDCISEINYTQIDNAKYIDNMMPMYNFIT